MVIATKKVPPASPGPLRQGERSTFAIADRSICAGHRRDLSVPGVLETGGDFVAHSGGDAGLCNCFRVEVRRRGGAGMDLQEPGLCDPAGVLWE